MSVVTTTIHNPQDLPAFRPISRSRTNREALVASIKRRMSFTQQAIKGQGTAERAKDLAAAQHHRRNAVVSLLWARAEIERALWLETGGRMGSQYATLATTLATLPIRGASFTDDND